MNKEQIIQELNSINSKLSEVLQGIQDLNQDGNQFDYVTNPKLSDCTDAILKTVVKIDKIVYQKSK